MRAYRDESDPNGTTAPFTATWERVTDGVPVARVAGTYRLVPIAPPKAGDVMEGSAELCPQPLIERDAGIETLEGRAEAMPVQLAPAAIERFAQTILEPMGIAGVTPCPNLAATMLLSTLVGMRLPGRRATFLGFTLSFEYDLDEGSRFELTGTVSRLHAAAETMRADVTITEGSRILAGGAVEALVNPPATTMPTCAELTAGSLDLGLEGRAAIVVGGSRGIGETTAKLLALLGARVMLTYFRGREDAERIVAEIRDCGCDAHCFPCDVRDDDQVRALVLEAQERIGGVDILVNAAVHDFAPGPATDSTWREYLDELEVSVKGLHSICRLVVPLMREARGGKIINFSSVAVRNPVGGQSRYITAKSAVEGYTRSLAKELAASNIQVNLIVPNMTETDLVASIPTSYRQRLSASRDYGRHVEPAEVAQGVAFLASQWSNAMTGQALVLNIAEPPYA